MPWPGRERKLDGRQEAHLIAFACSAAPEGHTHWTLQLLADTISLETRQILAAKVSGEFVVAGHRYNASGSDYSTTSRQYSVRPPIEAAPDGWHAKPANGTRNLFMICERPKGGTKAPLLRAGGGWWTRPTCRGGRLQPNTPAPCEARRIAQRD